MNPDSYHFAMRGRVDAARLADFLLARGDEPFQRVVPKDDYRDLPREQRHRAAGLELENSDDPFQTFFELYAELGSEAPSALAGSLARDFGTEVVIPDYRPDATQAPDRYLVYSADGRVEQAVGGTFQGIPYLEVIGPLDQA